MIRLSVLAPWVTLVLGALAIHTVRASDLDLSDGDIPIVLTPTRLKQSLADVPASVTIITDDMIRKFGIRSVPEALRLVPGMAVDQFAGSDYRINYHGTNILIPRRMNVLIDGVSVYLPLLARVNWEQLPVAMEDIDRIEVTRGPNSASYGTNSMLAIINIITKHPKDTVGTTWSSTVGSRETVHHTARYGNDSSLKSTTFRMTLDHEKDDGIGNPYYVPEDYDGKRLNRLNMRAVTELGVGETLDTQVALIKDVEEIGLTPPYQETYSDIYTQEYYLSTRWRKHISPRHEIQIQAYASKADVTQEWRSCLPAYSLLPEMHAMFSANQSYGYAILAGQVPSGGSAEDDALAAAAINAIIALGADVFTPICVDANQNYVEERQDIEFQDTYVFSDQLRMVSGFGFRHDKGSSETLLGGTTTNSTIKAFNNTEYKPTDWLNINVGGFYEKDQLTGATFSPRIAANLRASANHSFRFVLSKGTRSPDIYEQRGHLSYHVTNYSMPLNGATEGYYMETSRSPENLERERIFSREIGYYGNFPKYGLLIDGKIFDDRLTHLISTVPRIYDFDLTNENSVRLVGTEWQINFEPTPDWMLYLAYGYLENRDATHPMEEFQYSRHSGALGISHMFEYGLQASFAIYGANDVLSGDFATRKDFTLSKTFLASPQGRLSASFTARHFDASDTYAENINAVREERNDGGTSYYLTLKLDL